MRKSPHASSAEPEDKDGAVSRSTGEDGAGRDVAHGEASPPELVELDISDPHFMAGAYDTYAGLRAKGPVSRVKFAGGEEGSDDGAEQPGEFFGRDTFFVTHYDEVAGAAGAAAVQNAGGVPGALPESPFDRPARPQAAAQIGPAELHGTGHA